MKKTLEAIELQTEVDALPTYRQMRLVERFEYWLNIQIPMLKWKFEPEDRKFYAPHHFRVDIDARISHSFYIHEDFCFDPNCPDYSWDIQLDKIKKRLDQIAKLQEKQLTLQGE